MNKALAIVAVTLLALGSPALAQQNRNKSNQGIQSPTQEQRLDNGTVIPHGASGRDTTNLGGTGSGSEAPALKKRRVSHHKRVRHHPA
jgi:hypothetical protein